MKQTFFILGAALLFSCNIGTQNTKSAAAPDSTHVCCSDTLTCCMDTAKTCFPCVVEKCEKKGPGDCSVYVECSFCVHCSTECKVGDTLNIRLPKHD